ncbi:MAG: hypothetical protein HFE97_06865 [Oscillospiraceae bacterium]|nr:hypothetical protein [Oscillospiraceae bacterium]
MQDNWQAQDKLSDQWSGNTKDSEQVVDWQTQAPETPYLDHPALLAFRALYTHPKDRGNRKKWIEYFTTDAFLEVWRDFGFAAALCKEVSACPTPPHKGFLRELSITYGVRYRRETGPDERFYYVPGLLPNADFDGIGYIVDILNQGEPVTWLSHMDERMRAAAFLDYTALLNLAWNGLEEENRQAFQDRLGRYQRTYLVERPPNNDRRSEFEILLRSPDCLRLLNYFFRHAALPPEAFRMVWTALDLEHAGTGSNARWYGSLRETVLRRAPQLAGQKVEHFLAADKAFNLYKRQSQERDGEDTPEEQAEVDTLFAREDLQRAFLQPEFADKVERFWLEPQRSLPFLAAMKQFCLQHSDSPQASALLKKTELLLQAKIIAQENRRDEAGEAVLDLRLSNRPFWRYYLTIAFPNARPIRDEEGATLAAYLLQTLSPSQDWWMRCIGWAEGEDKLYEPPVLTVPLGSDTLTVSLGLRYLQYHWNGQPVWEPWLPWEEVRDRQDSEFWLLLPMTWSTWYEWEAVRSVLLDRLSKLPLPPEVLSQTADCLTGYLCTRREEPEVVFAARRENRNHLYVCTVDEDGILSLWEETPQGRTLLPDRQIRLSQKDLAETEGVRRLEGLIRPGGDLFLPQIDPLPDLISARPSRGQATELTGCAVTLEALSGLLAAYCRGELVRLELTWGKFFPDLPPVQEEEEMEEAQAFHLTGLTGDWKSHCHSLALLREGDKYMCLYFDDERAYWHGLVGVREEYYDLDWQESWMEPFGLTTVERYHFHRDTWAIQDALLEILPYLARGGEPSQHMGWSVKVMPDKRLAYNRLKRELAGFPPERARNWIRAGFELPTRPHRLTGETMEGKPILEEGTPLLKDIVQYYLSQYLQGKLAALSLQWNLEPIRTISLYHERQRWLLVCSDESFDHYLVADQRAYLDAEGKVRQISVQNQKVPFYLVHKGPGPLRDALDLLLPNIKAPDKLLQPFGVWSPYQRS